MGNILFLSNYPVKLAPLVQLSAPGNIGDFGN